jgi:single-strand DNA-binding protein
MSQYLAKGKPVFVEGRLKLDQWQDKEGNNRSMLKVVIEGFQFIDSKGAPGSGGGIDPSGAPERSAPRPTPPATKPQPAYTGPQHEPLAEDDIPF